MQYVWSRKFRYNAGIEQGTEAVTQCPQCSAVQVRDAGTGPSSIPCHVQLLNLDLTLAMISPVKLASKFSAQATLQIHLSTIIQLSNSVRRP